MDDCKNGDPTQDKSKFTVTETNGVKSLIVKESDLVINLPEGGKNTGLKNRHSAVSNGEKITLIDRLYLDLFQQDRFIPNGVDIRLRFNRKKSDFYMMTAANSTGKVKLLSVVLLVRKVGPILTVLNANNERLNPETAHYPLRRVDLKTFTIPTGA